MAHSTGLPVWKEAPFIRLIIPLIAGILLQWYCSLPVRLLWIILCISATCRQVYVLTPLHHQFHARWWHGAWLHIILFAAGGLLCFYKNIQHQTICITNRYTAENAVLITIEEPLTETAQSCKTIASVQAVITNYFIRKASGNILLYLEKDSLLSHLQYGSQLILRSRLQPVKNTGNPGGFDYQRYCAFQGIVYQAYVKKKEVTLLPTQNENRFKKWLFASQQTITSVLKKYIPGRREAGLAEAMLIGYKDDLDKTLVQSYANTGVVHIIAISGLHLGLIYWLLAALCKPLSGKRYSRIAQLIIIISGLWLFSVLAGGSPSVLRSAVMFSFVVIGAYANRKTSIYNSLAASAFLLLCYNPFWLWDAGFQLSYAAVLSLAIFMKPLYNVLFIQNKWLNLLWKSIAVTLAAQILTVPISVYLFHQFPNLFLLANLLAVPLSSLVIMGEIALCVISLFPFIAHMIGLILQYLIYWLNTFIEHIGQLPFALLTGLSVNLLQVIYMYAGIYGFAWWLLRAKKTGMHIGLSALLLFAVYNTVAIYIATHQQKLIVYNVPKHSAIDIFSGRQCLFKGDSLLQSNESMRNFYLQPCRLVHRIITCSHTRYLLVCNNLFRVGKTSFLVVEKKSGWNKGGEKIPVDVIILSHNPPVHIATLTGVFTCRTFVFDASNTHHNVTIWKKECDALGISSFSVADRGAFVLNLY